MPEEQPVGLDQQEGLDLLRGVDVFVTKFFLRQRIIVQCDSHRHGLLAAATCFLIPRALWKYWEYWEGGKGGNPKL